MDHEKLLGINLDLLLQQTVKELFESTNPDATRDELEEKLKQEKMSKAVSKSKARYKKNPSEPAADEGSEGTPKKPTKIKHEKIPDINAKSIKDKINNIRAGKSLKDSETMNALKLYFQKLNGPERIALYAFLSGLDKILGQQSEKVKTPHQEPYNIDMEKDAAVESGKIHSQPKGAKEISSSKKSETPIVVGEHADTSKIKAKLWRK